MLSPSKLEGSLRLLHDKADLLPHGVQALFVRCIMAAREDGWGYSTNLYLLRGEPRLCRDDVRDGMAVLAKHGLLTLYKVPSSDQVWRTAFYRKAVGPTVISQFVELNPAGRLPAWFVWKIK